MGDPNSLFLEPAATTEGAGEGIEAITLLMMRAGVR
jgi:hypothetical protein